MAQRITDIDWNWVANHIGDDPIKLRLKKDASEHMLDIVQIECRKKAGKKLSTTLEENPSFIFGNTLASEQSTSDMLAQYHASLIPRDSKVCDLTSGLGIDVLHLAGRTSSVTAIELQPDLCEALEINSEADPKTKGKVRVICGDCRAVLKEICDCFESNNDTTISNIREENKDKVNSSQGEILEKSIEISNSHTIPSLNKPFDVIFIDPARRSATGKRLFSLHDCQPDVVEMIPIISKACDTLIIKMSPMLDITQVCRELPSVSQIIVLGINRECKELIAVCRWDKPVGEEPEISVVTLSSIYNDSGEGNTDEASVDLAYNLLEDKGSSGDNPEKRLSSGYLLDGFSLIKVNKFSFYASEEAKVSEVNYVDKEEINSWLTRLDCNALIKDKTLKNKEEQEQSLSNKNPINSQSVNKKGEKDNCPSQNKRDVEGFESEKSHCSYSNVIEKDGIYCKREREPVSKLTNYSLYLYEPSPSMMKAGAYQLVAKRFSLKMVSANSHLYLSEQLVEEFPGIVWRVRKIYPLNSSTIKALSKQNLKGEVAVRNYPMEAEALRKKLKIVSGVGYRYMATRSADGVGYLFELESAE